MRKRFAAPHVLVTGGAGYLGSVLVPRLLAKGFRVTVLDNFLYRQTPLMESCADPRLEVLRGDARDKSLMTSCMRTADVIIPLACLTGAPLCARDPWAARATNRDAVRTILDLRSRRQRILFPTTNSGYGIAGGGTPCTEDAPLRPVSLYGRLKVEIERRLLDEGNVVTFRFATLFGMSPRMRLDLLVNDFVWRAVQDGFLVLFEARFKRNYLHIRDAAKVFLHALDRFESMKDRPYNVGLSDANLSKWELCEAIREVLPCFVFSEAPVGKDPDQRNYVISNARIERTGFRPDHTLEDGIRELVKGYRILSRHPMGNV